MYIQDWQESSVLSYITDKMTVLTHIVRYITHDSCAISVMPPFNRLWAQISAVVW